MALLTTNSLPPGYNMIPFLAVHDPEADIVTKVRMAILLWMLRYSLHRIGESFHHLRCY